ncbi:MAG: hypothetical protein ACKVHP_24650 [Verrucomicrobiales bacterium]|jgi:hypothetical protein
MLSWANAEGKMIKAKVLEVKDAKARLQLPDGRIYEFAFENLSAESQKEIRELLEKSG